MVDLLLCGYAMDKLSTVNMKIDILFTFCKSQHYILVTFTRIISLDYQSPVRWQHVLAPRTATCHFAWRCNQEQSVSGPSRNGGV